MSPSAVENKERNMGRSVCEDHRTFGLKCQMNNSVCVYDEYIDFNSCVPVCRRTESVMALGIRIQSAERAPA